LRENGMTPESVLQMAGWPWRCGTFVWSTCYLGSYDRKQTGLPFEGRVRMV